MVNPKTITKANIGLDKGKIVFIGNKENFCVAENIIDAKGKYIIPGCIDAHVHFREPLRSYKEDWKTGSRSAACGGVTTVLDMQKKKTNTTHPPKMSSLSSLAAEKVSSWKGMVSAKLTRRGWLSLHCLGSCLLDC